MRSLSLLAFLSFAGSLLPSQSLQVSLTGTVEKAPAGACDPAATHRVRCTAVLLKSTAVDLKTWEGKVALLKGDWDLNAACVTVDVTAAEKAPVSSTVFSLLGYKPGRTVTLTTTAPAGAVVLLFFAFDPGFVPTGFLPGLDLGSFLLNPLNAFLWSFNLSIGVAIELLPIPNDPNLVGLPILFQTAYVEFATALGGKFLNPNCFTIVK